VRKKGRKMTNRVKESPNRVNFSTGMEVRQGEGGVLCTGSPLVDKPPTVLTVEFIQLHFLYIYHLLHVIQQVSSRMRLSYSTHSQ
jgi:hypothetical protein